MSLTLIETSCMAKCCFLGDIGTLGIGAQREGVVGKSPEETEDCSDGAICCGGGNCFNGRGSCNPGTRPGKSLVDVMSFDLGVAGMEAVKLKTSGTGKGLELAVGVKSKSSRAL
jgi:hypothetical protein